ncbi:amidase [Acidisphaera sp. L21]|uniref:amidase n=1 Tax=Acidisphaera sp. L21 TaxID=1641851 RepID=UPI00131B61C0|nr:amidase family protein [Acidisphaera sp. L21]
MSEPCDLPATEARRLIGRRALSPVELLESCISRIQAVEPAVNAMPALDLPGARAAAAKAEQAVMSGADLPPLHGLPLGVKDLTAAANLPFTRGSPIFRDHIAPTDERLVADLRSAGAIVLGKTNTPEFGAGANTRNAVWGATGNPFDPTRSAAGSSGGSGVALACGMVPIATGSDTGGSLRNPAAFNGIVGFRPTPGAIPNEMRSHGWMPMGMNGPMARNVPDAMLLMSAMVADDLRDPYSRPADPDSFYPVPPLDLASLNVAITPDFSFAPVEKTVVAAFTEKTGLFRHLFGRADDTTPDCTGADEAFAILRAVGFLAAHGDKVKNRPADVGPNIIANVEEGLRYSAEDVARALTLQTAMQRRWHEFFTRYDVVISPAISISPRPWSELYPAQIDGRTLDSYYHWLALAYCGTLAGHPCLSLPVGLDSLGMPFGLQLVGRRGGDAALLAAAAALEAVLVGDPRTARPVPDIARLVAAPPISGMPGFFGFG